MIHTRLAEGLQAALLRWEYFRRQWVGLGLASACLIRRKFSNQIWPSDPFSQRRPTDFTCTLRNLPYLGLVIKKKTTELELLPRGLAGSNDGRLPALSGFLLTLCMLLIYWGRIHPPHVHAYTHTPSIHIWKHSKWSVGLSVMSYSFCDPMDCNPPGSSVHGILQARILEWVAYPFSRGLSQPRNWTRVSCIAGRFFTMWTTKEACTLQYTTLKLTLATSGVTPPVQASRSCFLFLPQNGSVSLQSLSRGQLVATQNFLTINDQDATIWCSSNSHSCEGVGMGPFARSPLLILWGCRPEAHSSGPPWCFPVIIVRVLQGNLEQPWVHMHLLLNWRSEALCCCDLSQVFWPLCDSASSSVTLMSSSPLNQTFLSPKLLNNSHSI